MERIVYRITLDSHKTGIQRTLQGFETADNMARTIAVNITASGDTYEIPLDNVVAMMYVTTPNASEPSINECRIEDNTIYYDVLPIVEEGITEMKIKLIETSVDGAKRVLLAPKFVVEVTESGTEDDSAEQTTTFTALENAIAKAHGVYDQRLLNIEIGPDCVFRAIYADGTVYENHYLHEALYNGNALLSESWAKGGTGVREGEDVNNSLYFSNVSRSASAEAKQNASAVRELTDMTRLYSTYTSFDTNFATGELEYISATHNFDVDETTGELVVEGETFEPDAIVEKAVGEFLEEKTQAISKNAEDIAENTKDISEVRGDLDNHTHTAEEVGARSNTWMPSAKDVGASPSDHSHSAEEVGAHPNTWMPTASDVGAISYNKVIDVRNAKTVLEVANSMPTGGSFTGINGQPICTAEDAPLSGYEFHYLVLQDEFGRKRVVAISFSDNNFEIFTRRIFNGAWIDGSWNRLTDVFFKQSGGAINGNVVFNNGVHIVGGTDDAEGGQILFEVPRKGNFNGSITMDVCGNQIRWFANHAGTLKHFILDFSLFKSGNATIYTTKTIIGSDTDITAGTSALTSGFIYQVYE